ncbi:charged multivesicular body protein 4b-like [Cheilinus undulatus]|uniref:charged multivesicular body protein 4b-like n=1 Tax=Cheilinus undulatus TaxID=241271 RepID=UPI001BD3AA09|nr:charged multivesicular body protein 4b-like [Cheilinus undulatus]
MFTGGEKAKICPQNETETLKKKEESLQTKKELLKKKIEQELQFIKTTSRKDRRVALQALKRKKWYEKHLKYIDSAIKAITSVYEHIDMVNKLDDLMKDFKDEHTEILEMSDCLYTSLSLGLESAEGELLAELERLEKNLDQSLAEKENMEEKVSCSEESSTASPSLPAKTEEDEVDDQLEYLRRWANDSP